MAAVDLDGGGSARHLRDQADAAGLATMFIRKGWDVYIRRRRARPSGWTSTFKGDPVILPMGDPWSGFRIGPPGSETTDKAKRATLRRHAIPDRSLRAFMKQGVRAGLTTDDAT